MTTNRGKNFKKIMLLWQGSIVEIDYGLFRVVGPYFIGKSQGTFKVLIFGLWSFIRHLYYKSLFHTPLLSNQQTDQQTDN